MDDSAILTRTVQSVRERPPVCKLFPALIASLEAWHHEPVRLGTPFHPSWPSELGNRSSNMHSKPSPSFLAIAFVLPSVVFGASEEIVNTKKSAIQRSVFRSPTHRISFGVSPEQLFSGSLHLRPGS